MDFMREKKASGEIKHIGFSAHARVDVMRRFLEAYGDEMEFARSSLIILTGYYRKQRKKLNYLTSTISLYG